MTPFHVLALLGAAIAVPLRRAAAPFRRAGSPAQAPPSDPAADAPRPGVHSLAGVVGWSVHASRRYALHGDGRVVADLDGAPATWRDEGAFWAWVDRQPILPE